MLAKGAGKPGSLKHRGPNSQPGHMKGTANPEILDWHRSWTVCTSTTRVGRSRWQLAWRRWNPVEGLDFRFFLLCRLVFSCLSNCTSILLRFVDYPVEGVVVLKRLSNKEVPEELPQVGVIWLVVEAKGAGVVKIDGEFLGRAAAKHLDGSCHLHLPDSVILLFLGGSFESLPWERTTAEVEHDIAQGLHVVTARLFGTKVSVD
jgi:hypothetical protein